MKNPKTRKINIRSLLGHRQVPLATRCLGSLQKFCQDSVQFILHDDGTLNSSDIEILNEALDKPIIISRTEADNVMLPILKKYPNCRAYRDQHPLGLKLFDICLMNADEEPVYFCDSDILFFRPFYFPKLKSKKSIVLMKDTHQAFSLRPWNVKPMGPLRVTSKANSGLIITYSENLDLDFVEELMTRPALKNVFSKRPQWVEQTCWSVLATRLDTYFFDIQKVIVASADMYPVHKEQVAIHFVSDHRGQLDNFEDTDELLNIDGKTISLDKAKRASSFNLIASEVQRILKRSMKFA